MKISIHTLRNGTDIEVSLKELMGSPAMFVDPTVVFNLTRKQKATKIE